MSTGELTPGRIFITGGTGFVGLNIRAALGARPLRLLVRPGSSQLPVNFGVEIVPGDVTKPASLTGLMNDCDTVIHLVAIINEQGGNTFDGVIRQGAVNVVEEAQRAGVERFILMSALGAHHNPEFPYFEAKFQAEEAVKQSELAFTIFRPSVIFGPGDAFVNTLADLVRKAPVLPVVGDGLSRFQPVHVSDVASVFARAVEDAGTRGQTYDLGGPEILTYEQLLDVIAARLGKNPKKVHIPLGLMKTMVSISNRLPESLRPPVTSEQLKMLSIDNSTQYSATAELIGRQPISLQDGIDYIA